MMVDSWTRWAWVTSVLLGCGSSAGVPLGDGGTAPTVDMGPQHDAAEVETGIDANPIFPIGPVDLGFGAETQMALTGNRLVVAWIGAGPISYALSMDRGATFPYVSQIPQTRLGDPIAAAAPDGSILVGGIGLCTNRCVGRLVVALSAKDATTFEPPAVLDSPYFNDHPWLTAATDGRLTLVYNSRSLTGNPPVFDGSAMQASTSTTGQAWETHDIVPLDMQRGTSIPTGSVAGTVSYALFYDSAALSQTTLEKSPDGNVWSPTAPLPNRFGAYSGQAVRSASLDSDVWLLYGVAQTGNAEGTAFVYPQGLAIVHSSNEGGDWQEGVVVVNDGRLYMNPELVVERTGVLDVVYYAGTRDLDPDAAFEWTRSTDAGSSWSTPVVLQRGILFQSSRTTANWLGDYVAVATDDDFAYFAWTANQTGTARATFARRPLR
jgi:hypothetical protein